MFHRENDAVFSPRELELIAAARRHLGPGKPKIADAYFRVRQSGEGCEVFVLYVIGYEGKKPVFEPCQHCAVLFGKDDSIVKVLRGPETWP